MFNDPSKVELTINWRPPRPRPRSASDGPAPAPTRWSN